MAWRLLGLLGLFGRLSLGEMQPMLRRRVRVREEGINSVYNSSALRFPSTERPIFIRSAYFSYNLKALRMDGLEDAYNMYQFF